MQATFSSPLSTYPVHVEGHLEQPSRGLWLIKWLLVVPHCLVLAFLWIGFFVSSLFAFVSVLFTARYPQSLFDFNVGVMRWSWRVGFYAFSTNGTDRYPPFTLNDVADYPARLEIDYPAHQRKGLPLIGWWLAGIPHYLIAGVFVGGGALAWTWSDHAWRGPTYVGLIDLLVFVSVVVLLFRGEQPRSLFDFVLGLNRWVLRVLAYAALMTPEYPPFRVDAGETEPAGRVAVATPAAAPPTETCPARPTQAIVRRPERWGPGRVIAIVVSSIIGLASLALLAAGGAGIVLDQTQRDATGYLMTSTTPYSTSTYAIVSASYRGSSGDWFLNRDLIGTVKVRVSSSRPVFIGIAPEDAVNRYLAGVAHATGSSSTARSGDFRAYTGGAPATRPAAQHIWAVRSNGSGTQKLTWNPRSGNWRIVVMNANGTPGVNSDVSIGARMPHLLTIGIVGAGIGLALTAISGTSVYLAARPRRS